MNTTERVRAQYERHSYPGHVPLFALPLPTEELKFNDVSAPRILVAGCGNFEPLVVARSNPRGHVTAVDLSLKNVKELKRRLGFAKVVFGVLPHRLVQQLTGHGLAPVDALQGDLNDSPLFEPESFDAIVCTGVLHHCERPEAVLQNMSRWLAPGGTLRIMVYAPTSRGGVYELQRLFRDAGLTPEDLSYSALIRACRRIIDAQPLPQRTRLSETFENYRDIHSMPGLIDGFFHAHDVPIPLESLRSMASRAGLVLGGFGRVTTSAAELRGSLSQRWERLRVVDGRGELPVNPVLLFRKDAVAVQRAA